MPGRGDRQRDAKGSRIIIACPREKFLETVRQLVEKPVN